MLTKDDLLTLAAIFERRAAELMARNRRTSALLLSLIADVLADGEIYPDSDDPKAQ